MNKCRTCLTNKQLSSDIFPGYSIEQLLLVTGIQILKNDGLPQKICSTCSKLVTSAILFREQCSNAEKVLLIEKRCEELIAHVITDANEGSSTDEDDNKLDIDVDTEKYKNKDFSKDKIHNFIKLTAYKSNSKIKQVKKTSVVPKPPDYADGGVKADVEKTNICDIRHDISDEAGTDKNVTLNSCFDLDDNLTQFILGHDVGQRKAHHNKPKNNSDLRSSIISKNNKHTYPDEASQNRNKVNNANSKTRKVLHYSKKDIKKPKDMDMIYKILDAELENSLKLPYTDYRKLCGNSSIYESIDLGLFNAADDCQDIASNKNNLTTTFPKTYNPKKVEKLWSTAVKPIDKEGLVKCKICSKEYKFKYFLRHANTHFDSGFTCEMCGKKFANVHSLKFHQQRIHGALKKHACKHCDYRAVANNELVNHMNRFHTGEKPFICDVCGDRFYQRSTLVQHMRKHFGVKKFKCEFCSRMFSSRSQVSGHRSMFHLYRYTFFCYACAYQSTGRSTVRNHLTKVHAIPRNEQLSLKYVKEIR